MDDIRTVSILLLGDPGCGKSTLLSRLSQGQHAPKVPGPLPTLHDLDQPFIFDISMYNRPYRFEFYDTASPENFTLLQPDFVILCFDITDRRSLINVPQVWRKNVTRYYRRDGEDPPLMVLGLKRDARVEEEGVIYPQEAYRIAQEMRCDRYAECSAVTGELISEVFEDIARTAAKTKTDAGGLTQGGCILM
ncbi:MAG: hypothetical protein L6R40_006724 [Gallowayella cf. fulva]|nr:MAG: hypothetical protein L6R40_006724 [Xanthomendoza cf. fulva]